jgi:hypothetical protein
MGACILTGLYMVEDAVASLRRGNESFHSERELHLATAEAPVKLVYREAATYNRNGRMLERR